MSEEKKIFRLRKMGTDEYFNGRFFASNAPHSASTNISNPIFNARGKDWKTIHEVREAAINYSLCELEPAANKTRPWPKLELVTLVPTVVSVELDETHDLTRAFEFLTKMRINRWSSAGKFVTKLAAAGNDDFRYLVWAKGNHPIPAISQVYIRRNSLTNRFSRTNLGETLVGIKTDTDMVYVKMQIDDDDMYGVWDYQEGRVIKGW